MKLKVCPCCNRPFRSLRDFPSVFIRGVEILPVPEAVDQFSQEAALSPGRQINVTPHLAAAYWQLGPYLDSLKALEGQEVSANALDPKLEPDGWFKWAFRIPDLPLYVGLHEDEAESPGDARKCEVALYGSGPNLGSAGGPTLQRFGSVAVIEYDGCLAGPCRDDSLSS